MPALKKRIYLVEHPGCPQITVEAKTPNAACRKAFKHWINNKDLKCQPETDDEGGFKNVTLELLD